MSAPISASALRFTWPDGTIVLDGLDLTVPSGRSGLVGANGSGKSTLLQLIAGVLPPSAGTVVTSGQVGYLPQDLTSEVDQRVTDFLGIGEISRAIASVEAGATDPDLYDAIGPDWDIEERALAELSALGLPEDVLGRRLGQLSGGEVVRLGLARVLLTRPDVLLLDEPTNNLDSSARAGLRRLLSGWSRTLVVVSHDRELLEHVDRIGELRDGTVRWYGGGFTAYAEQVAAQRAAAEQAVTAARSEVRRQRADAVDAERVLAQRRRTARRAAAAGGMGKALIDYQQNRADRSSAKYRHVHADRLREARARLESAQRRLPEDQEIRIDLPATAVPPGRRVLTTDELVLRTGAGVELDITGPDRVAVVGPNGAGKSTLLHTIVGDLPARAGSVTVHVPLAILPQRLDLLADDLGVAANVLARSPGVDPQLVRSRLARFLFRGADADRTVGSLSGGERFRATLAALLLSEPTPQLLLLDEPTNNLDLASYEALVSALDTYRGALVVASHDDAFLEDIGADRTVEICEAGPGGSVAT